MLKLAWRNIWRNRRRSLITMGSVFFAFLFCVLLMSTQKGTWGYMIESMLRTQAGHIQVHLAGWFDDPVVDNLMTMDGAQVPRIETLPGVAYTSPRLETFAMASLGTVSKPVALTGIDPAREDRMSSLASRVTEGAYLAENDPDGILLGGKLAEYLRAAPGDTLALVGQGYHGASAYGLYVVRGVVSLAMPEMDQGTVYTTLPSARRFVGLDGGLSGLLVTLDNPKQIDRAVAAIENTLENGVYEVLPWQVTMEKLLRQADSDLLFLQIIMFILYMIVGFGILSTVIMMTNERRHEFGVVVALGMQRGRLAATTAVELALMIALAIAAGLAVSVPLINFYAAHPVALGGEFATAMLEFGIEPILPADNSFGLFAGQAGVVALISAVVVLYPVRHILRLNVIKSLRP